MLCTQQTWHSFEGLSLLDRSVSAPKTNGFSLGPILNLQGAGCSENMPYIIPALNQHSRGVRVQFNHESFYPEKMAGREYRLVEIRRTSAFLTVITVPYRNTPYNTVQVRSV